MSWDDPGLSAPLRGPTAVRQRLETYWVAAFPDLQWSLDKAFAADDKVFALFTFTGTHAGDLALPNGRVMLASHRRIRLKGSGMYRERNRKIHHSAIFFDLAQIERPAAGTCVGCGYGAACNVDRSLRLQLPPALDRVGQTCEECQPRRLSALSDDIILETEDLTKEFAGFTAVSGVSLRVARGTIHALIGPNGAGKTTCFNLLTKFLSPTRGRIAFKGRDITALAPAEVARLGLVRSFQISAVFPHLSVLENVRIALQRRRGGSFDFWRSKRVLDAFDDRALALIADVGLASYADTLAVELPYGRKRALELATTLALDPEMMLLDEPTAGMGHEDIGRIAALIKSAAARRTVLMVEHNLSVVADLSDTITVLTRGRVLAEGDYATVSANADVREAYMGTGHE